MNASPLRKLFAFRPSMLMLGIGIAIALIVPNILFTINTEYGSSFYSYWMTGRVLFAQGQNPYADELFEQVSLRYPEDHNVSGFSLPLFAILPVLPFTFISNFLKWYYSKFLHFQRKSTTGVTINMLKFTETIATICSPTELIKNI